MIGSIKPINSFNSDFIIRSRNIKKDEKPQIEETSKKEKKIKKEELNKNYLKLQNNIIGLSQNGINTKQKIGQIISKQFDYSNNI